MMKLKLIYALPVALALMSSCSGNKLEPEDMVRFGVTVRNDVPTKVTDDDFEASDVLSVLGFLVKDGGEVDYSMPYVGVYSPVAVTPLSFAYSEVTAEGEVPGGKVYPSGYYWPKFDQCDYEALFFYGFYAYNSQDGDETTGPVIQYNADSCPTVRYVTDVTGQAPREDFLFARQSASANDVPLTFEHPLAKVTLVVVLRDWIGAYDIDWMFDDFAIADVYDCLTGSWVASDQTLERASMSIRTTENEVSFFAIPQTIEKFAVVWNYHKEMITLDTPLKLESGNRYTVTLSISANKVVGVQTNTSGGQQWDTVENNNNLN